jgi:ferredoxin-NADP reductase
MYRLVLYILRILIGVAVIFSYFKILPYDPVALLTGTLFLVLVSWVANGIFSSVFKAPTNNESATITALILALIVNPPKDMHDFIFLAWVAVLATASKYILAINKIHLFNPAAIAVVLTAFAFNQSASWWIGNLSMTPFVVIMGLLIARKIRKGDMLFIFFATTLLIIVGFSLLRGSNIPDTLERVLFHSSLFFFAFVMFTEPLTTPPTYWLQMVYGVIVGVLFIPFVHIGSLYSTPELALIAGNIFTYVVSPKTKLMLRLKEKIKLSADTYDFVFALDKPIHFTPGQYMEWTVPHKTPDNRGNRRYFTLASSPTENTLRIGVKFYQQASSFKNTLLNIDNKTDIVANQIAGSFTLPSDASKKLVFIAGGIGITPYRSIIRYMIDKNEKRDIVLFYSNKMVSEIVYKDVFDEAEKKIKLKTIYTLTDKAHIPPHWKGESGRIDAAMIMKTIPDYKDRIFYLSGPHSMVTLYEQTLKQMGVKSENIKIDFFPGFV